MKEAKIIKLTTDEKPKVIHKENKDQLFMELIDELNLMNEILSVALKQKDNTCQ